MQQFFRVICPPVFYELAALVLFLLFPFPDTMSCRLAAAVIAIPVFGLVFLKDQKERGSGRFCIRISLKTAVLTALFGIGACITANNLIKILNLVKLFPGFSGVLAEIYTPPVWMQILAVGIVIPAAEELMFRGLGFARLRESKGYWLSAVASSLLFALYHGSIVQGIYAFTLGLCMCWLYERTGTILTSLLFHLTANIVSIALTLLLSLDEATGVGISFYIMTLAASAVWFWSYREIKKNAQEVLF